jgi:predicted SnoaL-like aldol condensation-catalyzing enzyme
MRFLSIPAALLLASSAHAETPKEVVTAFADLAFVQGHAVEAARRYISPDKYVQHNPEAANGRDAFVRGFAAYVEKTGYRCAIKRVVGEGELVVVHSHCKANPASAKDRGEAVVDIFRVEEGLIVEHWDVDQPVPARSANANTMF